jgi:putative redox protein
MKANVKWVGDMTFLGRSASGHNVVFDASGSDTSAAPSPMEMVLMTMGACASVDVVDALNTDSSSATSCEVELDGHRVDTAPRVFDEVIATFVVTGHNLTAEQVHKAVKDSETKYCSVAKMLEGKVKITFEYQLAN